MGTTSNIDALKYADDSLRSDTGFMLGMIKLDAKAFDHATENLKLDKNFVTKAVENNKQVINYVSDAFKADPEFMFNAIVRKVNINEWYENETSIHQQRESSIHQQRESGLGGWRKDKGKYVRRFVDQVDSVDIDMLDFLGDALRSNEDFMLKLLKIDSHVVNYVHKDLLTNLSFIRVIDKWWDKYNDLSSAPFDVRDDKSIVLKIVGQDGSELLYASDRLKADKDTVLAAIKDYPAALKYADHTLQNDPDVVLEALELEDDHVDRRDIMVYASYHLVSNKNFMLKAIKIDPFLFDFASTDLMSNKEFIVEIIRAAFQHKDSDALIVEDVVDSIRELDDSNRYFSDKKFMLDLIEINSKIFKFVDDELSNSKEFVLDAVKANGTIIKFLDRKFRSDKEVIMAAVQGADSKVDFENND